MTESPGPVKRKRPQLVPPLPKGLWGIAKVVPFVALLFGGVVYVNHEQAEADVRWCALLVMLDEQYSSTPPTTELGRRVAAAFNQLRDDFEC